MKKVSTASAVDPRSLKVDDVVLVDGQDFYEVHRIEKKGVGLFTFTSGMLSSGATLPWDSPEWNRISRPLKRHQKQIATVLARREKRLPHMEHFAYTLPDGTVHVQNFLFSPVGCSGYGQHHVHTAAEFEEWAKTVPEKWLHRVPEKWLHREREECDCGLRLGQTREWDGRVWSR